MKPKSQNQKVLDYLIKGRTLTPLQAWRWWKCLRLGARIWDLNRLGYVIVNTKRSGYARYILKGYKGATIKFSRP